MYRAVPIISILAFLFSPLSVAEEENIRPNILLIVADDLGWNDLGYQGSEIHTPRIDELAKEGARLNRFYVQPSCSPTRAALMTGKSSIRLGMVGPLTKSNPVGLPLDQPLMPERLKELGYKTALVGKWHLGHRDRKYLPTSRGFDHFYGHLTGGIGYWDHVHGGAYDWQRNNKVVRDPGYSTHLLASEASTLIQKHSGNQPLFLYASFNAPHTPNEAPEKSVEKYQHLENPRRQLHAAMVSELDAAVGEIVDTLDNEGMLDNTLIWFMSDNGGLNRSSFTKRQHQFADFLEKWYPDEPVPLESLNFLRSMVNDGASDNSPLRKGKLSIYEGGVRVPAFVYWKGKVISQTIDSMITVEDVLPTVLGLTGGKVDKTFDGFDSWSFIHNSKEHDVKEYMVKSAEGEALYHYPWKLIRLSSGDLELYNVLSDPSETKNMVEKFPDRVNTMLEALNVRPRGERINLPFYKSLLNPSSFGGEELDLPWLEQID